MTKGKQNRIWRFVVIGLVSACFSFVANVCVAKMSDGLVIDHDDVPVAKWNVAISGADESVDLVAGGSSHVYALTVMNNSDIASDYKIELSNIPNGVWVGLDEGTLQEPDAEGKVLFTETGGVLDTVEKVRHHSLRFSANAEAEAVMNSDVAVNVRFEQEEL